MLDFHNHLIPGVDDGAQTIEQSCEALSNFARDGVMHVITTPHCDASLTLDARLLARRLADVDDKWRELSEHAAAHHPEMTLARGVELMLDTPTPIVADERLRLAGGMFLLCEYPFMSVPPRSAEVLATLRSRECWPIIAHPERYHGFAEDYSLAKDWKGSGGLLQINGGSLLGKYGANARRFAFGLLERGMADYLCSDYHARGQTLVTSYRALLEEAGGAEQAKLLTEINPMRILQDQLPLPVAPLRVRRSLWSRVTELFGA
jgi:protein-tyrosine phosphatase